MNNKQGVKLNPYLKNALENLALFRQQLASSYTDPDFNIFEHTINEIDEV
jgi:hypothetical protein